MAFSPGLTRKTHFEWQRLKGRTKDVLFLWHLRDGNGYLISGPRINTAMPPVLYLFLRTLQIWKLRMMTITLSLCFQSPPGAAVFAFLNVVIEYTSCLMVGCVLDCAKVMPSCAIRDSGTVQFLHVDIVGPQGGVDAFGACSALFQGSTYKPEAVFLRGWHREILHAQREENFLPLPSLLEDPHHCKDVHAGLLPS